MNVDHFPMLFAGLTLFDRLTYGHAYESAMEHTCATCNLNGAQRDILHRSYLVITSQDVVTQTHHYPHGIRLG